MTLTPTAAFHKYPETVTLDKRPEILSVKTVVATEKLHGTNFRVLFPNGMSSIDQVQFGGRNEEFGTDDGGKFYGGRPVRWFKNRPELLTALMDLFRARGYGDVVIYGEVCGPGIQKGVRYLDDARGRAGEVLFRAFDLRIGDNLVTHSLFEEIGDAVGLPRVPVVWRGEPSLAAFDALLDKPSEEGRRNGVSDGDDARNLTEGVVIRSDPLLRNVFGEWLIVKHKSEKFAEVAKENTRKDRPDLTPVETFARTFVTPGRVTNALGRLRDAGTALKDGMEDMPHLVPAVLADLKKEAGPEWQALLDAGFNEKAIRGTVTKTLGPTYRRMLLEQAAG